MCLTDVVLLVGHVQDICWGGDERHGQVGYDTANVAAFFAPAGAVVSYRPEPALCAIHARRVAVLPRSLPAQAYEWEEPLT